MSEPLFSLDAPSLDEPAQDSLPSGVRIDFRSDAESSPTTDTEEPAPMPSRRRLYTSALSHFFGTFR